MADIGVAYVAYLKTQSTVTDVVGSGADARIYTDRLPQGATLPAIVLHDAISGISYENLSTGDGIATRRMQCNCYADTKLVAESLRNVIRKVTSTYDHGTWGSGGDAVFVHNATFAGMTTLDDEPRDGSDEPRYCRAIDFFVTHAETAASP